MKRTVIIVEDEPLALKTLRDLLAPVNWLEVVGDARDGLAAVEQINRHRPDLVFLDINLPELSGIEVLKRITYEPAVIFTTAHENHAVAAFELSALDYLLKPFGFARFQQALVRAKAALDRSEARPSLEDARKALSSATVDRIFIRDAGRIVPVEAGTIERIDADGDYAAVWVRGKRFLVSLPLSDFEQRLDASQFVRVHRSHLVNLAFVESIEPFDNSQLLIKMKDGVKIQASRNASKRLRDLAI